MQMILTPPPLHSTTFCRGKYLIVEGLQASNFTPDEVHFTCNKYQSILVLYRHIIFTVFQNVYMGHALHFLITFIYLNSSLHWAKRFHLKRQG